MSVLMLPRDEPATIEQLMFRLGSVSYSRLPARPAPGSATEADLLSYRRDGEEWPCELVEGVLVEQPCSFQKALLSATLIQVLGTYVEELESGILLGAKVPIRLAPGLIRLPDVAFVAWSRFPNRELPREPILDLAPDLAVEILSESNTSAEMERKRHEYFAAGVRLVWYVDPRTRTAEAYSSLHDCVELGTEGVLDGQDVIPGFRLSLEEWFRRAGGHRAE